MDGALGEISVIKTIFMPSAERSRCSSERDITCWHVAVLWPLCSLSGPVELSVWENVRASRGEGDFS